MRKLEVRVNKKFNFNLFIFYSFIRIDNSLIRFIDPLRKFMPIMDNQIYVNLTMLAFKQAVLCADACTCRVDLCAFYLSTIYSKIINLFKVHVAVCAAFLFLIFHLFYFLFNTKKFCFIVHTLKTPQIVCISHLDKTIFIERQNEY